MAKTKGRKGMPSTALTQAELTWWAKILAAARDGVGVMIVTPVNWYQAPARLKGTRLREVLPK
jgi:hypothetical protein